MDSQIQPWGRRPPDFSIAGLLVQSSLNRLTRPDGTVHLEPRLVRVLVCLAARPGVVVTRAELLETVWKGVAVTDESLTRCISDLRRHFGDDPSNPAIIETIPKVGYRLIGPVAAEDADAVRAFSSCDALDRQVQWVLEELAGEPETQATLLQVIGRVYLNFGLHHRAKSTLERALELHRTHPAGGPGMADTLEGLMEANIAQGANEQALTLAREVLAIRRRWADRDGRSGPSPASIPPGRRSQRISGKPASPPG